MRNFCYMHNSAHSGRFRWKWKNFWVSNVGCQLSGVNCRVSIVWVSSVGCQYSGCQMSGSHLNQLLTSLAIITPARVLIESASYCVLPSLAARPNRERIILEGRVLFARVLRYMKFHFRQFLVQKDAKKHEMEIPDREKHLGQFGQNGCGGSCRQLSHI